MEDRHALRKLSEHHPELLDKLYQASADGKHWTAFLETLVSACSSRSARLLVMDRQAQTVLSSTKVNIDDSEHRAYVDYYVNRCPWRPELMLKPPGRFYSSYHDCTCPQDKFYRTEFYNDWARHLDIAHGLSGAIYTDSRYTVQLLIQRTRGQGFFEPRLAELVNRTLAPHIRQALQLSRTRHLQQQLHLNVMAAAERSFMPFLLVDERGHMLYQSPLAQALIDRWPGLAITKGRLHFSYPAHRARFSMALKMASDDTSVSQQALVLTPEGSQTPIRLLVTPLLPGAPGDELWPDSNVSAVYLQDPTMHLDVDRDLVARLFGLTEAEARAAAGVSLGADPKDLAERHEVSLHTVRTQLKSAMQKMGVHRQAELATRVILSAATRDRHLAETSFYLK
ncbi:MAG: helix-turn-helix transcriptional regulator [Natronospirillum sp.]|uniref:helix-turn-helix transcriptional regulator n=1 Tax=Natronospirillum sp. TaxID=2812955 RepID=UPI0025D96740|nr:helix-turn-helix transcriptional regulator [Natronospirillum sp.]MCH8552482.1 helix-turn-helix transcriptional regulator [Natronospirillum sp.]